MEDKENTAKPDVAMFIDWENGKKLIEEYLNRKGGEND